MNFYFFLQLFAIISLAVADTTTVPTTKTSSVSPTLIWVTGTNALGQLATTQAVYSQSFKAQYVLAVTAAAGSIGLGSLAGDVGQIRSYSMAEVRGNGANPAANIIVSHGKTAQLASLALVFIAVLIII